MKDLFLYTDKELMLEIKAENMFAFDILYRKYCKKLYNFGNAILKSQAETENLIQDVFLNFWENRNQVEKDASVKSYIFTITYNSAISIIRKKARESDYVEYLKSLQESIEVPVNVELEYNELVNTLDKIVNTLPQRQKEVYRLHNVEGLKYNEMATLLNISVKTIETHMSCALKTIREKLGKYSLLAILFCHFYL